MRSNALESVVCLVLVGVGIAALLTIELAEETASKFLLQQERVLGALDYRSLPRIYAIALIVLCTANIGLLYFKSRTGGKTITASVAEPKPGDDNSGLDPAAKKRRTIIRTVGTAILLVVYSLAMPCASFFLGTALFLLLLFLLYGKTDLRISLPLSLAGAVFFWIVFIKIANLPISNF